MPLTDQHRFGMQLAQMSRGWRAELDRRLAGLGLSQARWLVLLHLARFDEAPTQRELRDMARDTVREKKLDEAFATWVQEQRARAYVEYREPPQ